MKKTKNNFVTPSSDTGRVCYRWHGGYATVWAHMPAGACKDSDDNPTFEILDVEHHTKKVLALFGGGYLHTSNSGASGYVSVRRELVDGYPWLTELGSYRVDTRGFESHPVPVRGLEGVYAYVPWVSHAGVDENYPAVIVAGDTIVFCKVGLLPDLLESYRMGFPIEGDVYFDEVLVDPRTALDEKPRLEQVTIKVANLFGEKVLDFGWRTFAFDILKTFDMRQGLAYVEEAFGVNGAEALCERVPNRHFMKGRRFLAAEDLQAFQAAVRREGWRRIEAPAGMTAYAKGLSSVGWMDAGESWRRRTERFLGILPAEMREKAKAEIDRGLPFRGPVWEFEHRASALPTDAERISALRRGILKKAAADWRSRTWQIQREAKIRRWLETADAGEVLGISPCLEAGAVWYDLPDNDPRDKRALIDAFGGKPTVGQLAEIYLNPNADSGIRWYLEWLFLAHIEGRGITVDANLDDYVIRIEDSLAAGNCRPGTDAFVQRFFPGQTQTTYGELKRFASNFDVKRVLLYVVAKYRREQWIPA